MSAQDFSLILVCWGKRQNQNSDQSENNRASKRFFTFMILLNFGHFTTYSQKDFGGRGYIQLQSMSQLRISGAFWHSGSVRGLTAWGLILTESYSKDVVNDHGRVALLPTKWIKKIPVKSTTPHAAQNRYQIFILKCLLRTLYCAIHHSLSWKW